MYSNTYVYTPTHAQEKVLQVYDVHVHVHVHSLTVN